MRPSWDCSACGKPWPCDPARVALALEHRHDFVALSIYLWGCLSEAAEDGLGCTANELVDRFLTWLRPLAG